METFASKGSDSSAGYISIYGVLGFRAFGLGLGVHRTLMRKESKSPTVWDKGHSIFSFKHHLPPLHRVYIGIMEEKMETTTL